MIYQSAKFLKVVWGELFYFGLVFEKGPSVAQAVLLLEVAKDDLELLVFLPLLSSGITGEHQHASFVCC